MEDKEYDLAFSFAGEHREYVERTVNACKALGLKVFYDKDKNNDWWGNNFIREQRSVYSSRTRYFVPFISTEYLSKPIPMDEFSSAMMTAVEQVDGYILPVLMDDTQVPADLLHPHTGYLRAKDYTPAELAKQFQQRVGAATQAGQEPAQLGTVVSEALAVRLPKITPDGWSKYAELDKLWSYLHKRFTEGAEQLKPQGLICTVRLQGDTLSIRVERHGNTVAGLDVRKGGQMGDDRITWSAGLPRGFSPNSFNGWAVPAFDREAGKPVIEVMDMAGSFSGGGNGDGKQSYSSFFELLWAKVIEQIERT
jgi:TIR domain